MKEHIRLNEHSAHSWCGLLISTRPWISDEDYRKRKEMNLARNVCKNCVTALDNGVARVASGR